MQYSLDHFEKSTHIELISSNFIFINVYHFCLLYNSLLTILIKTQCLSGLSSNNIQIRNSKHASFFMVRYFGSPTDVHHYIFCDFSGFGFIQITLIIPQKHQQNTVISMLLLTKYL